MPKQRITKDMVVDAAFAIVRHQGAEQMLVKNIADVLKCSVQPVYTYCKSMEGLKQDVLGKISKHFRLYIEEHIDPHDYFRSIGQSYLQLAKEEPKLFQMYFMQPRNSAKSLEDLIKEESRGDVAASIATALGVPLDMAKELHKHMVVYTMGLCFLMASSDAAIDTEEMLYMMERAYEAFMTKIMDREKNER